eukprot:c164_g1_i1 orf=322-732(+)
MKIPPFLDFLFPPPITTLHMPKVVASLCNVVFIIPFNIGYFAKSYTLMDPILGPITIHGLQFVLLSSKWPLTTEKKNSLILSTQPILPSKDIPVFPMHTLGIPEVASLSNAIFPPYDGFKLTCCNTSALQVGPTRF